MKFGETLATHLTPEWRKQYISYSSMKEMILNAIANIAHKDPKSYEYKSYIAKFDDEFFQECEKELQKIDTFFAEKEAEAKRKFRELNAEVGFVTDESARKRNPSVMNLRKILPKRKTNQVKLFLSEYYLSLILLRNYQTLNLTGFRKILKKHDKKFNLNNGIRWFKSKVETANFVRNAEIQSLMEETEALFANSLENGDRSRAMKHLRVPPFERSQNPCRTFRLGFALGLFSCLSVFLLNAVMTTKLSDVEYKSCVRLHRGAFLLILFLFLIGVNVYGWQKSGVNHILIFEVNPRDHLTATHLMEIAAYFAVLWAFSFLGCLHKVPSFVPPHIYPVLLNLIMIVYWLNPIPIQWTSRYWLLKVVGRIVCAPFFEIGFADFWLADQIISLAAAFVDYQFLACLCVNNNWAKESDAYSCVHEIDFITDPIILAIPSWWRFAQSLRRYYDTKRKFPFLLNAGKYATAFPVAIFNIFMQKQQGQYHHFLRNPFFWCFMISRAISSIYSYLWDILMDFGLFKKWSGENTFLRDEIIYAPIFYYFAIIEDLLLRFIWLLVFFIEKKFLLEEFHLATASGILEVIRRYIWNYIRLENEHLNNAGHFRAVRDISVKLVVSDDQKRLESMMDERDGVYNRHPEKKDPSSSQKRFQRESNLSEDD